MSYPKNFDAKRHTLADVRAALGARTDLPASYIIDVPGQSIQIWYNRPNEAVVKHIHGSLLDKQTFDDFDIATKYFLKLCAAVLK